MSVEVNLKMLVRDFKQLSDFLDTHEYEIATGYDDYGGLKQLFKLVFDVEPSNRGKTLKGIKINTNAIKDMAFLGQKPSGKFFASAKLYFYRVNTNFHRSTYSDEDLTHALPNPVIADCNGDFPSIFVNPDDGSCKIAFLDNRDNFLSIKDYLVTNGE